MVPMLAAIVGLAFGSFANVLIDRVPVGRPITGRSQCDRCRRVLRWWELVPVVSAMLLRHRCRTCDVGIPFRVTAVELGSACIVIAVVLRHGTAISPMVFGEAIGLLAIGTLAMIDLDRGVVPDVISLPALGIVVGLQALSVDQWSLVSLPRLVLPIVVGSGFFVFQRVISGGRWVGDGDIRVGALMGALLPLPFLVIAFGISYIIGGAVAAVLLAQRRAHRGTHIPLVPFLAAGTFVAMFWGERILGWYGLV